MPELEEILKQIQELRKRIEELAKNHELTDSGVVKASQQLDERLNEYEKIIREKQSSREDK